MKIKILNLILAEVAVFIAVSVAETSPLAIFIPTKFLYLIAVLPPVFLLLGRNPFDFPLFVVLMAIASAKVLANSEIFYSLLDALYYLGFRSLSENLNSMFLAYKSNLNLSTLSALVVLFCVAQIAWNIEDKLRELKLEIGYPLAVLGIVAFAIYLFYPLVLSIQAYGFPLLFLGLIGVALIMVATYLLAST